MQEERGDIPETILALEQSLNERWSRGDCHGYLDTYSEHMSYFDPLTAKLLVGHRAVSEHILGRYKNPHIVRSEYRNPQVIVSDGGDLAVLSYNLNSFVADEAGGEKLRVAWNCTEVYRRTEGNWRIVHSHWSFTQHPAIMQNATV